MGGGGALCLRGAFVSIEDSNLSHNMAIENGGVIEVENCTLNIQRSLFDSNRARRNGGVMYKWSGLPITISVFQSSFTSNQAPGGGGGVLFLNSELQGSNVYISECNIGLYHAFWSGGVFGVKGVNLTVENTNIYNNTALRGNTISACDSNITIASNDTHYYNISRNTRVENCFFYDLVICPTIEPSSTVILPLISSTASDSIVSTILPYELTSTVNIISTVTLHSISPTKVTTASSSNLAKTVSSTDAANLSSTPLAVTETPSPTSMMTTSAPSPEVTESFSGDETSFTTEVISTWTMPTDANTHVTTKSNGIKLHPELLIFLFTFIII